MITRIEIDGFKSFYNFSLDLKPFQVFIGLNGSGKSNFFDAVRFLSQLAADAPLYKAFQSARGEMRELFTRRSDGTYADKMTFAVEMLLPLSVPDPFDSSKQIAVPANRIRYEISLELRADDRPVVSHERLLILAESTDAWVQAVIPEATHERWVKYWVGQIMPAQRIQINQVDAIIHFSFDEGTAKSASQRERSMFSFSNDPHDPIAYAARRELLSWHYFHFEPSLMREPNTRYPDEMASNGQYLTAALHRIMAEDEFARSDIARTLYSLTSEIFQIDTQYFGETRKVYLTATLRDGTRIPSQMLSDGTLRMLGIIALRNDPRLQGVVMIEEPENGVYPERVEKIVGLLKSMSTDFQSLGETSQEEHNTVGGETDYPLPRQVIVNTHSPTLLAYSDNVVLFRTTLYNRSTQTRAYSLSTAEHSELRTVLNRQLERYLDTSVMSSKLEALVSE